MAAEDNAMEVSEPVSTAVEETTEETAKTAKDYYFDSYSHFGIHEEMLKDSVRTLTYKDSIVQNRHLFQGKTVLDIGCGTGILCMFAADAGAARVIGIDCADIADAAREIVAENGFSDVIQIIKGKVEEIELPVDTVDIIVSEWMGYCLIYESMVDTVLYARDKWMVKDGSGILMPDVARLHITSIQDTSYRKEKLEFWDDVYGYKMSVIKNKAFTEPLVDVVPAQQIISNSCCLIELDLYTITKEDLDFSAEFQITFNKQDFCHAFVTYFDVQFSKCHTPTGFSTAPFCDYTHWKQTVFYIDEPILAKEDETVTGDIRIEKNPKNHRDLIINLNATTSYGLSQSRRYLMS